MTTRGQVAEIGGVGTYMTKALSEVRQLRQPECTQQWRADSAHGVWQALCSRLFPPAAFFSPEPVESTGGRCLRGLSHREGGLIRT